MSLKGKGLIPGLFKKTGHSESNLSQSINKAFLSFDQK